MWTFAAVVAGLLLVTAWVSRINARYEKAPDPENDSADSIVATAWDDFGVSDDLDETRAALDALLEQAPIASLEKKQSLVRMSLMAIRAERFDTLRAAARRAKKIDPDCAETVAMRALAAAHRPPQGDTADADAANDEAKALRLLERARVDMAGCASCSTDADSQILLKEVAMAYEAFAPAPTEQADVADGNSGGEARPDADASPDADARPDGRARPDAEASG